MGVSGFPQFALAAAVVGVSVAVVSGFDNQAGWYLAVIIVLSVLIVYPLARTKLTEFVQLIGK